jgi:outer membrane protein with beta-barrel domain
MFIKKIIVLSLLLIPMLSFAQDEPRHMQTDEENFFRVGFKGGVNINKINGDSYNTDFKYNYELGGFLQFNFSNRFGLQPEVNFVQSSSEFTNSSSDVYYDLFLDGTQKDAKLDYLEVPLLLNINVGESKHVKFQVGPAYGGLINQTVNGLKSNPDSTVSYKNADWSAIGGLWIQLPFINIGARYKLGLSNLNNSTDKSEAWKSQAIQIFAGVTF